MKETMISLLKSKILFATLVSILACVSLSLAQGGNKKKLIEEERCAQWELAAWNWGMAATAQESQAHSLLSVGQELRRRGYIDDSERRAFLRSAGDCETQAGGLLSKVVGNLDKAAACWNKAAVGHRRMRNVEKQDNALKMAITALENALRVCGLTADAYEHAAEVYGEDEGEELIKAATASEKAAHWREKLAKRR